MVLEHLGKDKLGVGISLTPVHVGSDAPGLGHTRVLTRCFFMQYSLSTKRSSPDDGNEVSPYSLSPVSNKR